MYTYFLIFRIAVLDAFEYRLNLLLHVFKYAFFTALTAMIWVAVTQYSTSSPMTVHNIVIYYLLAAITYSLTSFHLVFVETDIRLGNLSSLLLKPVKPFYHYLSFQFGISLLEAVLRAVILFTIIFIYFPDTHIYFIDFISFITIMLLAYVFCFTSYYCFSLLAFWFQNVSSIRMCYLFTLRMLSGIIVPIAFFPQNIQNILFYTPFPHLTDFPIKIITGKASLLPSVIVLSFWIVIVYCLYRILWRHAQKAYEGIGI